MFIRFLILTFLVLGYSFRKQNEGFFMCPFRSVKDVKVIKDHMRKRALEKFYEEVKNNNNLVERDYYIGLLKKKGFTF
jgi:hypothetical protein